MDHEEDLVDGQDISMKEVLVKDWELAHFWDTRAR